MLQLCCVALFSCCMYRFGVREVLFACVVLCRVFAFVLVYSALCVVMVCVFLCVRVVLQLCCVALFCFAFVVPCDGCGVFGSVRFALSCVCLCVLGL